MHFSDSAANRMRPLSAATFDTIPPEIRVMIYGEHILESLKQPYINVNAILPYIRDESITSVSRGEIAGTIQKYVGKKTVWNVESENSLKVSQDEQQEDTLSPLRCSDACKYEPQRPVNTEASGTNLLHPRQSKTSSSSPTTYATMG